MTTTISVRGAIAAAIMTIVLAMSGSFAVATLAAPDGPQGVQGVTGQTGQTGAAGPQGERGPRGHRGKVGKSGVNGADGATIVRDRACSNDIDVPLPYC